MPKLIRDRVPEIAARSGTRLTVRSLTREEFPRYLKLKLVEEAEKAAAAPTRAELETKIADVQEILRALIPACGVSENRIAAAQHFRFMPRGKSADELKGALVVCAIEVSTAAAADLEVAIADFRTALREILGACMFDKEHVELIRVGRLNSRGGFSKRLLWEPELGEEDEW